MNYSPLKTLIAKTEVSNGARELLKKAVDAGCDGSSLSSLCLFIQEIDGQISQFQGLTEASDVRVEIDSVMSEFQSKLNSKLRQPR